MKAALFDLDGVIIDSEGTYTKFWGNIGREYGCPSPTFAYDIKGTTLTDILDTHFPDPEVKKEVIRKIHEFEQTMEYPIFDGVIDFLTELRKKGIATAVVTSSDDTKMSYLWRQHPELRKLFDEIVTGSMVSRSKPDPEGYLLAAKLLGTAPEDACVFEDSYQGLEAGRRSGARVVALATTNPADTLIDKADMVISSFREFPLNRL